jgi:hypothetical protein
MYFHPEGLKVPAWVAYAAAAAFVLAGFVIFAVEARRARLYRWLVVALLVAMLTPGAWIAFGAGDRACTVGSGLLDFGASGLTCRAPFGVGAILLAVMTFVAFRAARSDKDAE